MADLWLRDGSNVVCQPLDLTKLFALMKASIMEVMELTELPAEHARSVLVLYGWSKEKAVEAYFSEDQYVLYQKAGIVIPGLDFMEEDSDSGTCKICFCDFEEGEGETAGCGHFFCLGCWKEYLRGKVLDESIGEELHCPSEKCPQRVPSDKIMKLCRDAHVYSKHQELCAMAFVKANKFLKRCPAPDCKYVISISESEPLRCSVTCQCGFRFCFECYKKAHDPVTCSRLNTWQDFALEDLKKKAKDEEEEAKSEEWVRQYSKLCPKCKSPIEKSGGCNHMTCKSCSYEFCWVCMRIWASHGDAYSCNVPPSTISPSSPESDAVAKRKLERFEFHKQRFDNHMASAKLEREYRSTIREKLLEFKNCQVTFGPNEVGLLRDGLDTLLRSRLLLAHSYIFAYYVQECKEWELYLENQGVLENTTESLTDYFQNRFPDDDLFSIKENLPALIKRCSNRIEAMLGHISDGYEKATWKFDN